MLLPNRQGTGSRTRALAHQLVQLRSAHARGALPTAVRHCAGLCMTLQGSTRLQRNRRMHVRHVDDVAPVLSPSDANKPQIVAFLAHMADPADRCLLGRLYKKERGKLSRAQRKVHARATGYNRQPRRVGPQQKHSLCTYFSTPQQDFSAGLPLSQDLYSGNVDRAAGSTTCHSTASDATAADARKPTAAVRSPP